MFSVQLSIKVLFFFLVHVNQSLSYIRGCRTDAVSIVFPVFFARFLSHLLYFNLSFLEGFRLALLCLDSVCFVDCFLLHQINFLRVELELNEQKNRIKALENIEETKPSDGLNFG